MICKIILLQNIFLIRLLLITIVILHDHLHFLDKSNKLGIMLTNQDILIFFLKTNLTD